MRLVARSLFAAVLVFTITVATAWAGLALWYRLPVPEIGRALGAGLFVLLGFTTLIALFGRLRLPAVLAFAVAFGGVLAWWSTITPPDRGGLWGSPPAWRGPPRAPPPATSTLPIRLAPLPSFPASP